MTVQTRKPKMNETRVVPLAGSHGRITDYQVNDYHVFIPELPRKGIKDMQTFYEYRLTCHSKVNPFKFPVCKGNANGTVCYHSLAAIKERVRAVGKKLSLPKNGEFASAVKLLNFGGKLVRIVNQNGKSVWGVVR